MNMRRQDSGEDLSLAAVDAETNGRHRSRKNTKLWCRGKMGVEHAPVTVRVDHFADLPCTKGFLGCHHNVICSVCSKVLTPFCDESLCPDLLVQTGEGVR